jgi:2-polyprenyl-3-methyl-5-hydroxy-6-metoxy-1,4-benzoquinol methylase
MDSTFWNNRYQASEFAYGTTPNEFVKEQLAQIPNGKLLFCCEGEGRNAVFAACQGHEVVAFDISSEGQSKALNLAKAFNTQIHFDIADASLINYPDQSFDAIFLIYAHLPEAIRTKLHHKTISWLKPNGSIFLEAFQPDQLGKASGGPKQIEMLYSIEQLSQDFDGINTLHNQYHKTTLNEGLFHIGEADIIRFIGKKSSM